MRILLIEDQLKISRFIERGLREEGCVVETEADGASGLQRALETSYDVIILDVMLPEMDGFAVLERLRLSRCRSRILMLTALDSVRDRVHGLEKGADDYLGKPFAFAELLARVRALLRRDAADTSRILRVGDVEVDLDDRRATRAGQTVALSVKELAVLIHFMRNAGRIVTRTQLAEAVWDENFDPMSNVIDVTIYHLREKLASGSPAPLIHTVRGAGYVMKVTP